MSNITLSPNASGTGTLTIAAPNTNSNRTLTLPDVTGTFNTSGAVNEVPAGSASAPAIYPTGDTNTGVFFPAADTVGLATAGVEAARVDSSGNLCVKTTSSYGNSTISASSDLTNYPSLTLRNTGSAYTSGIVVFQKSDGTNVGYIGISATTTTYGTSSDYRLKENVAPMTGALAKVQALKPVTYTWKINGSAGQGFIAHELQAVVPDCVTGKKDAIDADGKPVYQGVDTSFLVATLTAAIQELKAELDATKAEVAALKGN